MMGFFSGYLIFTMYCKAVAGFSCTIGSPSEANEKAKRKARRTIPLR